MSDVDVRGPHQQFMVFIEIFPRELRDVVSTSVEYVAEGRAHSDDSSGYESVDDAIVNAQNIGFRLRRDVKPENLFFFFGETVQSLKNCLFAFLSRRNLPFNVANVFDPTGHEYDANDQEGKKEPLAIVLCKLRHAEAIGNTGWSEQRRKAREGEECLMSWSELLEQKFSNRLENVGNH